MAHTFFDKTCDGENTNPSIQETINASIHGFMQYGFRYKAPFAWTSHTHPDHSLRFNCESSCYVSDGEADRPASFHKFRPKIAPEQAYAGALTRGTSPSGIGPMAAQQMLALQQEKASRTPAQQKIDSNVLYTIRMLAGQPAAPGVPYLNTGVDLDASNHIVVDMVANVTDELLQQIATTGGVVLYPTPCLRSIRTIIPPQHIETLAGGAGRNLHFPPNKAR
jgi:hypothetical protein